MNAGCIYTYNGKEYSEHEFKHLLLSGELDSFLPDDIEMPAAEKPVKTEELPQVPSAKSKIQKFKEKHLSQSKNENNAIEKGEIAESDKQQYQRTDVNREKPEAVSSNSDETGRQDEEKRLNEFQPGEIVKNTISGDVVKILGVNGDFVKVKDVVTPAEEIGNGKEYELEAKKIPFYKKYVPSSAFEKHGLQGTKTVDEIYNTPDALLSDILAATEQSYADAHQIISDYGNRILDLNKELKATKSKSEKAVIKARLEELAKERTQLEAEVEQRQMDLYDQLQDKVISRAKELGHKLTKEQQTELAEYALPYLTEGRMMENVYLTKTVQGLTDELINEYFSEKEESEPAAEKTEAPLSDRIKNINEERQQKINEVTKPSFSFETGLTLEELADTTENNRQKNADFKDQLAAIKKIADCLWA